MWSTATYKVKSHASPPPPPCPDPSLRDANEEAKSPHRAPCAPAHTRTRERAHERASASAQRASAQRTSAQRTSAHTITPRHRHRIDRVPPRRVGRPYYWPNLLLQQGDGGHWLDEGRSVRGPRAQPDAQISHREQRHSDSGYIEPFSEGEVDEVLSDAAVEDEGASTMSRRSEYKSDSPPRPPAPPLQKNRRTAPK